MNIASTTQPNALEGYLASSTNIFVNQSITGVYKNIEGTDDYYLEKIEIATHYNGISALIYFLFLIVLFYSILTRRCG